MELGFTPEDMSVTLFGGGGGSSLSNAMRLLVLRSVGRDAAGAGWACGWGGGAETGVAMYCSCIDTGTCRCILDIGLSFVGVTCWGMESLSKLRTGCA